MHAVTILFRAPYTLYLYALDVAAKDVPTLRDRVSRGAFCPRTLFRARPEIFRWIPREAEPKDSPGNPYEWCES